MNDLDGDANIRRRMQAVLEAPTENLRDLMAIAELDPAKHLRFQEWSGASFRGHDLRGMDFSGARLLSTDFTGARICGARFDKAIFAHAGLSSGPQTNLRAAADWTDFAAGWRKSKSLPSDRHLYAGAVFQDAPFAPEMVVVPPGRFWMGSKEGEGDAAEHPRHEVTIPHAIAVGRYPVTFWEWDFAQSGEDWKIITGIERRITRDEGWGRGHRPAINVSWEDSQAFVKWLSNRSGQTFRLLSEAEWEYACRAGSATAYCFGDEPAELGQYAWFSGAGTHPIGEKKCNAFGLYDMHGNVWEWCEDAWHDSYANKPEVLKETGGAWTTGDGRWRVIRGGSWNNYPQGLRSALRGRLNALNRNYYRGFRVGRTLSF